ncbi:MAG: hypothetical protein AAGH15_25060 [Myxococcota bacterium]
MTADPGDTGTPLTADRNDTGTPVTADPGEPPPPMTIAVRITDADGAFLAYAGGILELVSPAPFAPGAPTRFEVDGIPLEGKSLGSKRRPDGDFHVRFRLINLRREHRLRLEALAG